MLSTRRGRIHRLHLSDLIKEARSASNTKLALLAKHMEDVRLIVPASSAPLGVLGSNQFLYAPNADSKHFVNSDPEFSVWRTVPGFFDATSLADAFRALEIGSTSLPEWMTQSLTDATYYLIFENLTLPPTNSNRPWRPCVGYETDLLAQCSEIKGLQVNPMSRDELTRWISDLAPLKQVWMRTITDPRGVWYRHIAANGDLFNEDHISQIAQILGESIGEIRQVYTATRDPERVARWVAEKREKKLLDLLDHACTISSLIRGKNHEIMARVAGFDFAPHPHRCKLAETVSNQTAGISIPLSRSKVIGFAIASAFQRAEPEGRVRVWIHNVATLRKLFATKQLPLGQLDLNNDDVVKIARLVNMDSSSRGSSELLNTTFDQILFYESSSFEFSPLHAPFASRSESQSVIVKSIGFPRDPTAVLQNLPPSRVTRRQSLAEKKAGS